MSKAYSNKALPAGTIIREWRLEDVLGVGGFGIVYKGRGIYFGELVAIKEYFPSSISERDAEDTVVPIDSDAEEVHALGLKKFVEEAKLLWNLSTPTRHPNIVSVRSLFEIHGTAYMVMDFEDGVSLSKLLKQGRRFNERSLWNIIRPISEGLERAHRVGVLHRDIKPPNILITEDSRPVLIDFGSARFEAAEATSTKVTFHTPPYAAIEQYVKTYDQGPWTDIYALGVVLYECVTGEKPPEVLERLHGGLGTALADGNWPGFSKRFLQSVDAAMTIRPTERPQSISEWLAMFGKKDADAPVSSDEEPTRFFAHEVAAEEIMPVAPPASGINLKEPLETGVPTDRGDVQFKGAGQETNASKKKAETAPAIAAETAKAADGEAPPAEAAAVKALADKAPVAKSAAERGPSAWKQAAGAARNVAIGLPKKWSIRSNVALLAGGAAVTLLIVAVAGIMFGGNWGDTKAGSEPIAIPSEAEPAPVGIVDVGGLAPAVRALAEDARKAGAPAAAVNDLAAASEQLDSQYAGLQPLLNDTAQAEAATVRADAMKRTATAANVAFANALLRDADARAQRVPATVPFASAERLRSALANLRSLVEAAAGATDPGQSLSAARNALAQSQAFADSVRVASRTATDTLAQAPKKTVIVAMPNAPVLTAPTATTGTTAAASTAGVSPAKMAQFNAIISEARSMAKQVIGMAGRGSGDADSQKRKANAALARNYDKYLANLKDSMRGAKSDRDADRLIKQANQTKAYISFLMKQSAQ
ncbi:MAG: serine/threonine-protein kinase [Sphingomicrobium sp.]